MQPLSCSLRDRVLAHVHVLATCSPHRNGPIWRRRIQRVQRRTQACAGVFHPRLTRGVTVFEHVHVHEHAVAADGEGAVAFSMSLPF